MGRANDGGAAARDPLTAKIIGAYFAVYRALGWGFLEGVYRRAMAVGMRRMGLSLEEEVLLPVHYLGELVGEYRADLVVEASVIVEVKALESLGPAHRRQVVNYLKATTIETALLLNFGPRPSFERLVFSNARKEPVPVRF